MGLHVHARRQRHKAATTHLREIAGSVAVVVGAASGLGKQLVLELHAAGAHVAACDGVEVELEALAAEARAESRRASADVVALLRETLRPAAATLDANLDGVVSDAEAFDFFDTDNDNVLSANELRDGLSTLGIERVLAIILSCVASQLPLTATLNSRGPSNSRAATGHQSRSVVLMGLRPCAPVGLDSLRTVMLAMTSGEARWSQRLLYQLPMGAVLHYKISATRATVCSTTTRQLPLQSNGSPRRCSRSIARSTCCFFASIKQ